MGFKYNPFTSTFDVVSPNNYSIQHVLTGQELIIPLYQQMIVHRDLFLHGDLVIEGELVVL